MATAATAPPATADADPLAHRLGRQALRALVRGVLRPLLSARTPLAVQRRALHAARGLTRSAPHTRIRATGLGGVPAEHIVPPSAREHAVLLYLHGGGYCVGAPQVSRPITTHLARACGLQVYALDYRLAPEHPCPAAIDDACAAVRALRAENPARAIVLAGDSAGAGLALSTTLALREAGDPLPHALVLLSPWVDLSLTQRSLLSHRSLDPMLSADALQRWAQQYAGDLPRDHAQCSPLRGDLNGLPPTLIQVGSDEILLDDARRLHWRLAAAGSQARLETYASLWHVFQLHAGLLPAADEAIAQIAAFLRTRLN